MVRRGSPYAVQRVPQMSLRQDNALQVTMGPFEQRFTASTVGQVYGIRDLTRIGEIGVRISNLETGRYNEALIGQLEEDITWLNGGTINNRDAILAVVRDAVNSYRANRLVVA